MTLRLRSATLRVIGTSPFVLSPSTTLRINSAARAADSKHAGMDSHHRESVLVPATPRLAPDLSVTCPRLVSDLFETCPRLAWDLPGLILLPAVVGVALALLSRR